MAYPKSVTVRNIVTLHPSKEWSNREYKAYLNDRPYYANSTAFFAAAEKAEIVDREE